MLRAEQAIILYVQQGSFRREIYIIDTREHEESKVKYLKGSSSLRKLNPVMSSNRLLCVGGRLANAPIPELVKRPIILLKGRHIVNPIVRQ